MISQELTLDYIRKAKNGDDYAKEQLIKNNVPLVKSIINRFKGKGVEYDDLYQIGCIGFLKAINNFDEKFGVKFSTYAVPMIAGEIKRFLRDDGSIKVSRAIKTLWIKIKKYIDEYLKTHDDMPTIQHLSKEFEVDEADIVYAMDSSKTLVSLNAQFDEGSSNSQSVIDKIVVDDKSEQMLDKILLKEAINNLGEREKKIVLLRYFRGKTQSEVADVLGVSQVQISRIESKILQELKNKLK